MAGADYFDASAQFTKVAGDQNAGSSEIDTVLDAIEDAFDIMGNVQSGTAKETHQILATVPSPETVGALVKPVAERAGQIVAFDSDGEPVAIDATDENENRFAYTGYASFRYLGFSITSDTAGFVYPDTFPLDHDGFSFLLYESSIHAPKGKILVMASMEVTGSVASGVYELGFGSSVTVEPARFEIDNGESALISIWAIVSSEEDMRFRYDRVSGSGNLAVLGFNALAMVVE